MFRTRTAVSIRFAFVLNPGYLQPPHRFACGVITEQGCHLKIIPNILLLSLLYHLSMLHFVASAIGARYLLVNLLSNLLNIFIYVIVCIFAFV